jgi:hypothetical protein
MTLKHTFLLATLGAMSLLMGACTTQPSRAVEADGTYCHRIGKSYSPTLTCTLGPVPTEAVEQSAKQFEPTPGAITLYIVRQRWGDPVNRVPVIVDALAPLVTIPDSVIRLRLTPGEHQVVTEWQGTRGVKTVTGRAGDVVFVELAGSTWAWGSTYRWADIDATNARKAATSAKLIADVDLQH